MPDKIPVLYLDNTFTFGGAINSLLNVLKSIDTDRFIPVLVSGQPESLIRQKCGSIHYYKVDLKLPWIHNSRYQRIAKFPVFRLKLFLTLLNVLRNVYWVLFITLPEAVRYYKIGKRHEARIVHLNNILGSQLAGIIAAKLLKVPCVAHLRDFEEIHPITKFYAGLIDRHIAISTAVKKNLMSLGVPNDKIRVVFDCIDLDEFDADVPAQDLKREFGLEDGDKAFGLFARIVEWKGIREYVAAAQDLLAEFPRAKAFVVGGVSDGAEAYYSEIKSMVCGSHYADRFVLTGYRHDVPALMKLMDVVVHNSLRPEPFGMVIIEAMAMGKPVVAAAGGGPEDIVIDGVTGFLFSVHDKKALNRHVTKLLNDPEMSRKMGSGRKREVPTIVWQGNSREEDRKDLQ